MLLRIKTLKNHKNNPPLYAEPALQPFIDVLYSSMQAWNHHIQVCLDVLLTENKPEISEGGLKEDLKPEFDF